MRYSLRIPLLAIGVVLGYGFAFGSMFHHRHHRDHWERHVADICVGAAQKGKTDSVKTESPTPRTTPAEP
jgi:hypothetical protein